RHLQRIARFGAVDVHRAGDRIDAREIESLEVRLGRFPRELPGRGIDRLELDRLARRDAQAGREGVVPAVVDVVLVDRVAGEACHGALLQTATVSAPSITRLAPEMRLAAGLARNTTPLATSCGVPKRCVGLASSVAANRSG